MQESKTNLLLKNSRIFNFGKGKLKKDAIFFFFFFKLAMLILYMLSWISYIGAILFLSLDSFTELVLISLLHWRSVIQVKSIAILILSFF